MKTGKRVVSVWLAAVCLITAGFFASSLLCFRSSFAPARAEGGDSESGRLLYYVDAGNMSDRADGMNSKVNRNKTGNDASATARFPSKVLAPVMTNAGYSFPTSAVIGNNQLYNSYNDKLFGADEVSGKEWGLYLESGEPFLWNKTRFLTTGVNVDGYDTMRFAENASQVNDELQYKFEVDDGTTPLRVFIGTCLPSNFAVKNFTFFINGEAKGKVDAKGTELNYAYEGITGVWDETSGKYFVTLVFGNTTERIQGSVARIFIEESSHVTPIYSGNVSFKNNQVIRQGAEIKVKGALATTAGLDNEVDLEIDAGTAGAIRAAKPFSELTVTGTYNGMTCSGTVFTSPETLIYFADAGAYNNTVSPATIDNTAFNSFNAAYGNTLNGADKVGDRAFSEGSWGYTTNNKVNWAGDPVFYRSIRNINTSSGDASIGYDFTLDAGLYNVYYGVVDMWQNVGGARPNRPGIITAGANAVSEKFNTNHLEQYVPLHGVLEGAVASGGKLSVTVSRDGGDPALSYLAVARVYNPFDVPAGTEFSYSPYFHEGGVAPSELPVISHSGYDFGGWFRDSQHSEAATAADLGSFISATTKIYAKMTPKAVTVALDYGEGVKSGGADSIPVVYGTAISGLPVVVAVDNVNRVFDGWYTTALAGGAKYADGDIWAEADAATLYARFVNRIAYTVTYRLNDSSEGKGSTAAVNTSPASYNKGIGCTLSDPVRAGYSFGGWYSDPAMAAGKVNSIGTDAEGNLTFYAKWTAGTYTVNLDYGNATPGVSAISAVFDAAITLSDPVTTGDYFFAGWYTQANGNGKKYENGDIWTEACENQMLYAHVYSVSSFEIEYVLNDGSGTTRADNAANPKRYDEGEGCVIADASREGYNFDGWYGTQELSGGRINAIGADASGKVILYAKWTAKSFTVTYNTAGGAFNPAKESDAVAFDSSYTLSVPAFAGHTFLGWFAAADGNAAYTDVYGGSWSDWTELNGRILYAHWSVNTYTVTYRTDLGTIPPESGATYTYGTGLALSNPEHEHYLFDGWFTEPAGGTKVESVSATDTGNKILYAQWTPKAYEIEYILNGGTNHVNNAAAYSYGAGMVLADPVRTGYTFAFWSASPDFSDRIEGISAATSGKVTVYAKWTLVSTVITLDYAGGKDGENATEGATGADYGAAVTGLPVLTRGGYVFSGWYTDMNGAGSKIQNGDIWAADDENVTLYAYWTQYTVYFETNGGGIIAPQSAAAGAKVEKPDDPKRSGYKFAGWFGDGEYKNAFDFETGTVNSDCTLYAKWDRESGCNSAAGAAAPLLMLAEFMTAFAVFKKKKRG